MVETRPHIPFGETIPPDARKADFALITVPESAQRLLTFSLALPRIWKEVPDPPATPSGTLSAAATFAVSDNVSVTVLQLRLPFEVNLVDWLEYQCHLRRFTIGNLETLHSQNGTEVHAVAQTPTGDFLRMVVLGDAGKVLWLVGRSIASLTVEFEQVLGLIAASIRIKRHSGADSREVLKKYRDASRMELLYPASWQPQRDPKLLPARAIADFRILEKSQTIAYMRVESEPAAQPGKPARQNLLRRILKDTAVSGIQTGLLQEIPKPATADDLRDDFRWIGDCDLPGGKGQIAILIRLQAARWLIAVLISPGKELNPMAWMRGKRFFEIAVASLSPSD